MIEIQKDKIEAVLLTISSFNSKTGQPVSGLLFEDISLGTKRKLQKISKWLISELTQLKQDYEEAKDSPEDVSELLAESVKSDLEHVSLEVMEQIKTSNNYDFDLIELIAK